PPAPVPAHELPARAKSPPRHPSQDAKVEGELHSASDSVPLAAAQPTGAGQAEVGLMSAAINDRTGNSTFPTRIGRYSIVKNLGKGTFSVVYLASIVGAKEHAPQTHPSPWELLVAIKVIPRVAILEDNRLKASVDREIQLLEYASGHPGVVRFVEVLSVRPDGSLRRLTRKPAPNAVSTSTSPQGRREIRPEGHRGGNLKPEQRDDCLATSPIPASTLWGPDVDDSSGWDCLVLEYVAGGELFDWIMDRFSSGDTKGAEVIDNGLESVAHAEVESAEESRCTHEDDIPYRTYPDLKVTDFGLARLFDPASPLLTTRCGSEEYAAPEIILGQPYDGRLTDAWALGVI
ncbi:MAG: kinase-like domain-containing protein, partial [Olpidium bornovanus]